MKHQPAAHRRLRPAALVVGFLLVVAACGGGAAGSASPSASAAPPASPAASASPGPSDGPVDSAEEAAERALAQDPMFADVERFNPDMIGACCFYEVVEADGGYEVTIQIGWGDCPAGCINKHTWVYAVADSGEVLLLDETGPSLEPGVAPGSN
jgi:hypothetical protein